MSEGAMDGRITLDYEGICAGIEQILEELKGLYTDKLLARALGRACVQHLREQEDAIRRRLYGPFQLVVMGEFKRGKSTLINALLGEEAVPTAVTPETVTVNLISYADEPAVQAVLSNRRRVALDRSELSRDRLEELMKRFPAGVDHIDIGLPNERLREITIIDTPGLEDLMEPVRQQAAESLLRADAIVYVISARAPLSHSEQAFLSTAVLPQSFSRVLLAVNMADTLETEENLEKIEAEVGRRAGAISSNIYVYVLSALETFRRRCGRSRPETPLTERLARNFDAFERDLERDVLLQRSVIKSSRGVALTRALLRDAAARTGLARRSLEENLQRLDQTGDVFQTQHAALSGKVEAHKAELSAHIREMRREAGDWMREFLGRLREELSRNGSAVEIGDLQRYLQFFVMDSVKSAIFACTQKHQREIGDLLAGSAKDFSQAISQEIFGTVQTQIADSIADISWTGADTMMFAGDMILSMAGLSGVVGPLYTVGQAIIGAVRQKSLSKKQVDIITPFLQAFESIELDVLQSLNPIYDQLETHALDKLEEIYQSQMELSAEMAENARHIAADESIRTQDVLDGLTEALETIRHCEEMLRDCE